VEKASALAPMNNISRASLGYVQGSLGHRPQALAAVAELEAATKQRYVPALALAIVYEGLGENDQAFAALDRAYAERYNRLAYLGTERIWDKLRSDPRFDALRRRIGLPI